MFAAVSDKLNSQRFFEALGRLETLHPTTRSEVHTLIPQFKNARWGESRETLSIFGEEAKAGVISQRSESISGISEVNFVRIDAKTSGSEGRSAINDLVTKLASKMDKNNPGALGFEIPLKMQTPSLNDEGFDGWVIFLSSFFNDKNDRVWRLRLKGPSHLSPDDSEIVKLYQKAQKIFDELAERLFTQAVEKGYELFDGGNTGDSVTWTGTDQVKALSLFESIINSTGVSETRDSRLWFELSRDGVDWEKYWGDLHDEMMPIVDGRPLAWLPDSIVREFVDPIHIAICQAGSLMQLAVFLSVTGWRWNYEISDASYREFCGKTCLTPDLEYEVSDHSEFGLVHVTCCRKGKDYFIAVASATSEAEPEIFNWIGEKFTVPNKELVAQLEKRMYIEDNKIRTQCAELSYRTSRTLREVRLESEARG